MGLSRNKVAVPEGAAGTPPFWRRGSPTQLGRSASEGQVSQRERLFLIQIITEERQAEKTKKTSHPVRTLLYVHNFRSVKIITIFDILQAKANLSKVSDFI